MAQLDLDQWKPKKFTITGRNFKVSYSKYGSEIGAFQVREEGTGYFAECDWSGKPQLSSVLEIMYEYGDDPHEDSEALRATLAEILEIDTEEKLPEAPKTCEMTAEEKLEKEKLSYYRFMFDDQYDSLGEEFLEDAIDSLWLNRDESIQFQKIVVDELAYAYEEEY